MNDIFNLKNYYKFALLAGVIICIFHLKIGVCFILGTCTSFINNLIIANKFPSFDLGAKKIILRSFLMLGIQGVIIFSMALGTYFIGDLKGVLAGFAAMIIPTFYFYLRSIFKK